MLQYLLLRGYNASLHANIIAGVSSLVSCLQCPILHCRVFATNASLIYIVNENAECLLKINQRDCNSCCFKVDLRNPHGPQGSVQNYFTIFSCVAYQKC